MIQQPCFVCDEPAVAILMGENVAVCEGCLADLSAGVLVADTICNDSCMPIATPQGNKIELPDSERETALPVQQKQRRAM
jgi:hypothetical protein